MIGNVAVLQKAGVLDYERNIRISFVLTLWILSGLSGGFCECAVGQVETKLDTNKAVARRGADSLWTRNQGSDWPGFLGTDRDGKSPEKGILTDWSDGKLKVVWELETGQGYGAGSIVGGRYFHFDRNDEFARLRCLNVETGKELWVFSYRSEYEDLYGYDSGPRASPIIDDDRVYIYGVEGKLFCLNSLDGSEIWNVDTAKKFGLIQNFFGVGSTPAISGDTILVMVGGSGGEPGKISPSEMPEVEPNGSAMVGFDKLTGEEKFRIGDDLASYSSIKLTQFDGQEVALLWARENLWGIDPHQGKTLFKFSWRARPLESVNASTPIVLGQQIFLTECYGPGGVLLELAEDNLKQIWSDKGRREKSLAAHWNTPVLHNGFLYGSSGRNPGDAVLKCVELATGEVAWSKKGLARSSVTLIDEHLIVMGEYGILKLLKATPDKYEEVTELDSGSDVKLAFPCWAAPIVSHGLMIVHDKHSVICFDLIPNE